MVTSVQLGNSVSNSFFQEQYRDAFKKNYCSVTTASTQILLANNVISELGFYTNKVTGCVTSYEMKLIAARLEKHIV
jgi:hypothetical protein